MPPDPLFAWLTLGMVGGMFALGVVRAVWYRLRGLRVVVVDWRRSAAEILCDTLTLAALVIWFILLWTETGLMPILRLRGWFAVEMFDATAIKWVGVVLLAAAVALYAWALWTMGRSWRLGIDREPDSQLNLVTSGPFAWSRNPIYLAFDLSFAGVWLVHGRTAYLLLAVVMGALLDWHIRREERFLVGRFGQAYHDYAAQVGRYLTLRQRSR